MPIRRLPPEPSTASPPARWSNARPAPSRNWSRTRSTPARREIEVQADGGGLTRILIADDGHGMAAGRAGAGGRAPRHLQARARRRRRCRPAAHLHPRLPRRGPALDRLGRAPDHHQPARGARPTRTRSLVEGGAIGACRARRLPRPARRAGRGARPVLRHPRPAEVHEVRALRGHGHLRRDQAPGHGPRGRRLHPRPRRPPTPAPARRTSGRPRDG